MKFCISAILFVVAVSGAAAFAPSTSSVVRSTKLHQGSVEVTVEAEAPQVEVQADKEDYKGPVTAEYINAQLEKQLAKLRLKDQTSKQLTKEVSFRILFDFF